jgi:nucleoside-diphosphate-sugar epimerase
MALERCLVTGGAGFIGSHIAQTLLERGVRVCVLDNLSGGRRENLELLERAGAEILVGDVRQPDDVRRAMRNVDLVFHHAAIASVQFSIDDPAAALETNLVGTQNVLLAARGGSVRRIIYASSAAVYGDSLALPKLEDMQPEPLSPYALHKLAGEGLCHLFTRLYGLETVALRYFNVFGPRQDPNSDYAAVIPRFVRALVDGARPSVYGDGTQTRDFVYIADVVEANLLAAEAPRVAGSVINVGRGERVSLLALLATTGELLGVSVAPRFEAPRPGDIHDSVADISRARRLLSYVPRVDFREGLARTVAYFRQAAE